MFLARIPHQSGIRKPSFRRNGNRRSGRLETRILYNYVYGLHNSANTYYGEVMFMPCIKPNYSEILRLGAMGLSQQDIAVSIGTSTKTVNKIIRLAKERGIEWCPDPPITNDNLAEQLFKKPQPVRVSSTRQLPDLDYCSCSRSLSTNCS